MFDNITIGNKKYKRRITQLETENAALKKVEAKNWTRSVFSKLSNFAMTP